MALAFRSSSYATAMYGNGLVVTLPAGVQNGDLLIYHTYAIEALSPYGGSPGGPGGNASVNTDGRYGPTSGGQYWTSIFNSTNLTSFNYGPGDNYGTCLWTYNSPACSSYGAGRPRRFVSAGYKTASSEPGAYQFDYMNGQPDVHSVYQMCIGEIVCYSGYTGWELAGDCEWEHPWPPPAGEGAQGGTSRANGTSWVAPSIDIIPSGGLICICYNETIAPTGAGTITVPGSLTQRTTHSNSFWLTYPYDIGTYHISWSVADQLAGVSSPTSTRTFTSANEGYRGTMFSIGAKIGGGIPGPGSGFTGPFDYVSFH